MLNKFENFGNDMSNKIEVTREQLERWRLQVFEVKEQDQLHDDADTLFNMIPEIDALLAATAQPINPLQAEVIKMHPAPFLFHSNRIIVDANNSSIFDDGFIRPDQYTEREKMICEALNEYWAKHKV